MVRLIPRVTPGTHRYAVVLDARFAAVVPASAETVAGRLTARVGTAATLEELVSLVPADVDAFAVVVAADPGQSADGVSLTAVVRGDVVVELFSAEGRRRFTDQGIRPWLLADFRSVAAVVVHAASAPDAVGPGGDVPAGEGLVLADRLDWRVAERASAPHPTADLDTVVAVPAGAVDRVAGARAEGPTGYTGERPSFGFSVDDGPVGALDGVHLLGRDPHPQRVTTGPAPQLVRVPSPTRSISSTHLELRREGDVVVATDLRSTNGTVLRPPSGEAERLRPGESRVVLPGTVLEMGDDTIVTIRLLPAPDAAPSPRREGRTP